VLAIIILFLVFILIIIRRIGKFRLHIWQIMTLGAAGVLVTGQISVADSVQSVNLDVLLFLFGVFVIGRSLEDSGYLGHLTYRVFRRARSMDMLVFTIMVVMSFASAILMNDTLAIIGTPVMLHLAGKHDISPKLLLLALAFSITTGSVMSPIGNPQNLLIALDGDIANPFVTFLRYLLLPTLINILLAFIVLRLCFRQSFTICGLNHSEEPIKDPHLAFLSRISLLLLVSLIILKVGLLMLHVSFTLELIHISLIAAIPIIAHTQRWKIISRIDWHTLIFFISMFILMQSVWNTGFFQHQIGRFHLDAASIPVILAVSIILSQFISNVPLVALFLPILTHAGAGVPQLMALAAGSTIAGNLTILGAASNVIIIQNAEKHGHTVGFMDFFKIGIPMTLVNSAVYYVLLV
jgi:Na+/H+ antiporter NhaD/arsenite permease-like protein